MVGRYEGAKKNQDATEQEIIQRILSVLRANDPDFGEDLATIKKDAQFVHKEANKLLN